MCYEFRGKSISEAVGFALGTSAAIPKQNKGFRSTRAYAGPLIWGPWVDVFTQFGASGPEADEHVTTIKLTFNQVGELETHFEIEITGAIVRYEVQDLEQKL